MQNKKLYVYFRDSDATCYNNCALEVENTQRRVLCYTRFALMLVRSKMQYQAEKREDFNLI